jgi:hypothetical protein
MITGLERLIFIVISVYFFLNIQGNYFQNTQRVTMEHNMHIIQSVSPGVESQTYLGTRVISKSVLTRLFMKGTAVWL